MPTPRFYRDSQGETPVYLEQPDDGRFWHDKGDRSGEWSRYSGRVLVLVRVAAKTLLPLVVSCVNLDLLQAEL